MEPHFNVDADQLAKMYRDYQRKFHPDLHGSQTEAEQEKLELAAASVNHAFTVLKSPYDRVSAHLLLMITRLLLESARLYASELSVLQPSCETSDCALPVGCFRQSIC